MQSLCYICYTQREREGERQRERRSNLSVVWFNMLRVSTLTYPPSHLDEYAEHPPRATRLVASRLKSKPIRSRHQVHTFLGYIYMWIYVNIYECIRSCICLTADSISATRIWISLFVIRSLFANCATKCRWQLNLPKRIAWNVVIFSTPPLCLFPHFPSPPLPVVASDLSINWNCSA